LVYKFIVDGTLKTNNEFIEANRSNVYAGNNMKQEAEQYVSFYIKKYLGDTQIKNPIHISYIFVEKNRRRDKDNIASFAMKVIQDALVACEVIKNDGWKNIKSFSCDFKVDKEKPRIEVFLVEDGD